MACVGFSTKWLAWKPKKERKKELFRLIHSREKTTTIRKTEIRGFRPGKPLNLYFGLRTKGCQKIAEAVCVEKRPIRIDSVNQEIRLLHKEIGLGSWVRYSQKAEENIIKMDGFPNKEAFYDYFDTGEYVWHRWIVKEGGVYYV